jgi:hypothetical protein
MPKIEKRSFAGLAFIRTDDFGFVLARLIDSKTKGLFVSIE